MDGLIYVVSARGQEADWFQNILVDPRVEVQVKSRRFEGLAEPITDSKRVADFLGVRLQCHPRMIRALLCSEGLRMPPSRGRLEQYAATRTMVIIRPTKR
jgi:hypothetical protein